MRMSIVWWQLPQSSVYSGGTMSLDGGQCGWRRGAGFATAISARRDKRILKSLRVVAGGTGWAGARGGPNTSGNGSSHLAL